MIIKMCYMEYLFLYHSNVLNLTQFLCLIYTIVSVINNFACTFKIEPLLKNAIANAFMVVSRP
jgi:hypothetical protein